NTSDSACVTRILPKATKDLGKLARCVEHSGRQRNTRNTRKIPSIRQNIRLQRAIVRRLPSQKKRAISWENNLPVYGLFGHPSFSPQRPLYRAWQQNKALVESWRDKEYPEIAKRAKREGAVIFFADEAGIRSNHHAGTTWARVGQTPIVTATGARFSMNMLSAVNAQGHFRFMTVDGAVNA